MIPSVVIPMFFFVMWNLYENSVLSLIMVRLVWPKVFIRMVFSRPTSKIFSFVQIVLGFSAEIFMMLTSLPVSSVNTHRPTGFWETSNFVLKSFVFSLKLNLSVLFGSGYFCFWWHSVSVVCCKMLCQWHFAIFSLNGWILNLLQSLCHLPRCPIRLW